MKLNRITLDQKESQWLFRNVTRTKQILEKASEKDPAVLDRSTYKTLKSIEAAHANTNLETLETDLMVSRKQKLIVASMVMQTLLVLQEKIIPEYERRGLTEYLSDCKMKLDVLKRLYKKLQ